MFAVIGVKRDAQIDGPQAIECIKDGFATKADAEAYAFSFFPTQEREERFGDLYVQPYETDAWAPAGGRCFYFARRALRDSYERFQSYCTRDQEPLVVIGECDVRDPSGTVTRGLHAWVEAGDSVFDFGSYLYNLNRYPKDDYYKNRNVTVSKTQTIQDITLDPE